MSRTKWRQSTQVNKRNFNLTGIYSSSQNLAEDTTQLPNTKFVHAISGLTIPLTELP